MKKVFFALFLVDGFLALFIYFWKGETWLINSQIAFFSSSFIMFSSMLAYKGMVERALYVGAIPNDERDTLDTLEDPYDLYDDKVQGLDKEKTLVDVVKEERAKLKTSRRSIWQTSKDAKASVSFYRLGAYTLLLLGFFYLNSNKLLELIPYLIFLSIPPFIIVFVLIQTRK